MEVSDEKIPWNANSGRYFHFKLQQGDEGTRVISLCERKLSNKRGTDFQHVTNVGMSIAKNIEWTSCL